MDEYDSSSKLPRILIILVVLVLGGFLFYKFNPLAPHPDIIVWNKNPVTLEPISFNLDVTNPDDQSLLFNSRLLISGQTASNATVIINGDGNISEVDADKNGNFSQDLTLDEGLNQITVTAFNDEGNQKSITRQVYYSKEQI